MSEMVPSTEELIQLVLEGNKIDPGMADDLELLLNSNPDDLVTRFKLLGFYETRYHRNPNYQKHRGSHILWIVNHLKEHPFLSESFGKVAKTIEPEFYQTMKSFWLSQTRSHPQSLRILVNAAASLIPDDLEAAKAIAVDAEALNPTSPEVKRIWESIQRIEKLGSEYNDNLPKSNEYP